MIVPAENARSKIKVLLIKRLIAFGLVVMALNPIEHTTIGFMSVVLGLLRPEKQTLRGGPGFA